MSILDDAIREHLELKRAHGADAAELKKLEDEAFGPPARPDAADALAEAPTEFLATEGGEESAGEPSGRRVPNVADLQEAPPPPKEASDEESPSEEEEVPAAEEDAERHAIAEQPTEHFDVEAEIDSSEAASPSDEELADAEISEPRLAPAAEPLSEAPAEEPAADEPLAELDEEDDFFSEQRLSDELSQALDAPIADEDEEVAEVEDLQEAEAPDDDLADEDHLPEDDEEYEGDDEPAAESDSRRDDVLEDTPDFLEDTPEDDDLWFEQRPPKDFDFDD